MDRELKRKLLERKFSSVEYMEEMAKWHQKAIDSLLTENRVLSNIRGTHQGIEDGIKKAKSGDLSYIESVAAELHSIFRNLDSIGWGWWKHIHHSYEDDFRKTLGSARDCASNIMWTLMGAWKNSEIFNERITGPIDEAELLRYLKPGERP